MCQDVHHTVGGSRGNRKPFFLVYKPLGVKRSRILVLFDNSSEKGTQPAEDFVFRKRGGKLRLYIKGFTGQSHLSFDIL